MTQTNPTLESLQTVDIDFAVESMARVLLPALQAFYDSPEGQAIFEEWKQQQEKKPKKRRSKKDQKNT